MRLERGLGRALAALGICLLAACALPDEPREGFKPEPRTPAPPVRPVDAAWSFSFGQGSCAASVAHPGAGITITAGPGAVLALATRAGAPVRWTATRVTFQGPGGSWGLRLRRAGSAEPGAAVPLNEATEGWVRALLTGGTLRLLSRDAAPLAVLTVPDAGVAGRDWFGCVSQLGE